MSPSSTFTDQELFSLIAQGDEEAFEQLFHSYSERVSTIIFRIVRSETITKDIMQEVFLQLWLGRDRLTQVEQPSLWIFRIAYNCSYRNLQQQQRQARTLSHIDSQHPSSETTQDDINFRETSNLIHQAIDLLPAQSRKIYDLNRVRGLKPQEIADELGINVQSVRNSLTRSAIAIREHLARHGIIVPLILVILYN